MQEMRILDQKLDFCETTFSRQLVRFCSFARVQQAIRDVTDRLLYPRPVLERREKSIGISRPEFESASLFLSPFHKSISFQLYTSPSRQGFTLSRLKSFCPFLPSLLFRSFPLSSLYSFLFPTSHGFLLTTTTPRSDS